MMLKFKVHLGANREAVPFNYAHRLCGIFHHWLGPNELHSMMSLYSLGWLHGGRASNGALQFPQGAFWEIGIYDSEIAERLVRGLLIKEFHFHGMPLRKAERIPPPDFNSGYARFMAGSPVVIRRVEDDRSRTHLTFEHEDSSAALTRVIRKKWTEAGRDVSECTLQLRFDPAYRNPKTKLVDIKGIKTRGSLCPVEATGTPDELQFLWTVGAGELTGVGFGSMMDPVTYRNVP